MDCHFSVWGVLAFLSLALLVSLTLNISHCMKKKQDCASANCLMHAILRLGSCTILTIPFTKRKLHLCCTCGGGQANTGDFNKAKYTCAYNLHKQKTCAYKLISPNIRDSANMHKDYEENNPSYDGYHREDYPVYGNLNQDILEEACYEQMKSQPQRPVNQLQVESANQMCYASLDHSVKRKCRKPRKKDPSLAEDEEERSSNSMVASKVIIYLNSEQLMAKNTAKVEAIHDDPIRLMGLIHNTKGEN